MAGEVDAEHLVRLPLVPGGARVDVDHRGDAAARRAAPGCAPARRAAAVVDQRWATTSKPSASSSTAESQSKKSQASSASSRAAQQRVPPAARAARRRWPGRAPARRRPRPPARPGPRTGPARRRIGEQRGQPVADLFGSHAADPMASGLRPDSIVRPSRPPPVAGGGASGPEPAAPPGSPVRHPGGDGPFPLRAANGRTTMASVRAVTVIPGTPNSLRLEDDWPEPAEQEGPVLVEAVSVGICGTDQEIVAGDYGERPARTRRGWSSGTSHWAGCWTDRSGTLSPATWSPGSSRTRTRCPARAARSTSGTCAATAATPSTASRSSRVRPGPLADAPRVRRRARPGPRPRSGCCWSRPAWSRRPGTTSNGSAAGVWQPRTALITGAGPVGLLAAMLATQRGLDVHVLDRVTTDRNRSWSRALGATYHAATSANWTWSRTW